MLDPSKPVCTRDGRKVTILSTSHRSIEDNHQYSYPIRAVIEHPTITGSLKTWNFMANGQWKSNEIDHPNNLINERPWHLWLREIYDPAFPKETLLD